MIKTERRVQVIISQMQRPGNGALHSLHHCDCKGIKECSDIPQPQRQFLLFSNFIAFTNGSHTHTHTTLWWSKVEKSNINTHLIKSTLNFSWCSTHQYCRQFSPVKRQRENMREWGHEAWGKPSPVQLYWHCCQCQQEMLSCSQRDNLEDLD